MLNYTHCNKYSTPVYMAPSLYSLHFSEPINTTDYESPAYHVQNTASFQNPDWQNPNNLSIQQCIIDFTIPQTMTAPVFLYYRLTGFYQNHRQYIKSFDADQLSGKPVSGSGLGTNCNPLAVTEDGTPIYPCGLIANSMFNGTIVWDPTHTHMHMHTHTRTRTRTHAPCTNFEQIPAPI